MSKENLSFFEKRKGYRKLIFLGMLIFITFIIFCPTFARSQSTENNISNDKTQSLIQSQLQGTEFANQTMYLGIWVVHIYSYQYTAGTYTLDMYVYFFWTDPNVSTANWYLTNGYPINSNAKVLVASNNTGNFKYEVYRITATLNTPPDAKNFPFDQITMNISLELINPGYPLNLAWLQNQTGVDSRFVNPIWKTTNIELSVSENSYPIGSGAPEAVMSITQERIKQSSAISSLFPPIMFCIISAISFLFSLKDPPSVGLRLGLNTSMLITTILFLLSISPAIPPSTSVTVFGVFIISVIIFLSLNLIVTISGFALSARFKNEKLALRINRWGFLISIVTPVLLYLILITFRA
jgi:hypothetical protein